MEKFILLILVAAFFIFIFSKLLNKLLLKLIKRKPKRKKRKIFLTKKTKAKADRKYKKLLAEFKRKHKRIPTKNDLFRVVIAASHHTYPVKGKNVRRWTKGKRGHINRQKVRKYLLKKYDIDPNYKIK